MAAQFEPNAGTRVALIGRDDAVRAQLHSALAEAGAQIVFEADLRGLSLAALRGSTAEVVIINLEPGSEDGLDAIDDLLVDGSIEVVFNESEVTSKLVGWDLARWARHLAAKVAGHGDATPPAPPGAEPLPQRDLRLTQVVAPPSPVRPAEELQMQPFADEARSVEVDVPASRGPELPSEAAAEPSRQDAAAMTGFQIERPGELAAETPFEIDLGEIESSLGAIGDGGSLTMPRRAASDAPTVVLSRDELQQHLSVDPGSLQGIDMPRRLGADEPTTVLDLAEVEASLAAIGQGVTTLVPEPEFTVAMAEPEPGLDLPVADAEPDFSLDFGSTVADPSAADSDLELALDLGRELGSTNTDAEAGLGLDVDLPDFDPAQGGFRSLAAAEGESLDLGMDADVAALAAQFDSLGAESAVGEATADLAQGFDFSLDLDLPASAPAQPTPAASAQPRYESGPAPAPARQSSFGELSLAGLGDEVPVAAPVERAAASSFDFSSINLSLEPTEDERAASTAQPATMAAAAEGSIRRVIVLGASIGGPDALRTFLAGIPQDFPALFLLVQHLENGFFNRLAQQLQKSTPLKLRVADDGAGEARMGEVLVVPSTARFSIDRNGVISRQDYAEPPRYKPCIDDMLRAAADAFGRDALAIVFSGMAGDAIEGASYITAKGGEVWAQDPSSCVVSSMVDGAMARGVVEFTGSPRELAERCVARFGVV